MVPLTKNEFQKKKKKKDIGETRKSPAINSVYIYFRVVFEFSNEKFGECPLFNERMVNFGGKKLIVKALIHIIYLKN